MTRSILRSVGSHVALYRELRIATSKPCTYAAAVAVQARAASKAKGAVKPLPANTTSGLHSLASFNAFHCAWTRKLCSGRSGDSRDRKSVVKGKSVAVRVDHGGR